MKNKIYTVIIALFLISTVLFTSCKKYLDIKPKGYTIPQTVEDYERILNSQSLVKSLTIDMEELSDDLYDNSISPGIVTNEPFYRLYHWMKDPYVQPSDIQYSLWTLSYASIYQYNVVITEIDNATGNATRKKIAKAKARVGRAAMNYFLVNHYAKPYNAATADADLGIPLLNSTSLVKPIPARASLKETFEFMIKDIEESLMDIPTSSPNPYVINRAGAYGWLARIYLTMNNHEKAAEAAQSALAIYKNLQDFNELYLVNTAADGSENFLPDFSDTNPKSYFRSISNIENLHVFLFDYTRGAAGKYLSRSAAAAFEQKDLRHILVVPSYYIQDANKIIDSVKNWNGRYIYMPNTYFDYSVGPTVPEMYLIHAEGAARAGNISEALLDLNTLRKKRFRPEDYKDLTAQTKNEAIQLVLNERRRELLFKGLRWLDMRRLNSDPTFGFTAIHELAGQPDLTLPPNSPRYVLSIPPTAAIGNVVQNP